MSDDKPIDAEVVPTQALTVRPPTGLPTVADLEQQFALAVRQRELLADYIKKQLVKDKHFYTTQGQKPSLTKEGAEIILLPHGFVPDYELVSGPDSPPEGDRPYQITVKCILRRNGDPDSFVGSGIGSAGSMHRRKDGSYAQRQPDRYLCHNATMKMAQKSAMIAATINSTAASEFFTQDMEPVDKPSRPQEPPKAAVPPSSHPPAPKAAPAKPSAHIPPSLEMCRAKFAKNIEEQGIREKATQYLIDLAWLLPTETIEQMELRYVPQTKEEYLAFLAKLTVFSATGKAHAPYPPGPISAPKPAGEPTTPTGSRTKNGSGASGIISGDPVDQEWYNVIVPIPRKGVKRDAYLKHPDTIGSLYEARHGNDDESNEMRQRLWGFLNKFEPKPWVGKDGKTRGPNDTDIKFRKALDEFGDWFEKNHPGEDL